LLQLVREKGDWETWIEFFLEGVIATSEQGVTTANRLLALFEKDEHQLNTLGRASASAHHVHAELKRAPIISVPLAARALGITQPTIQKSLDHMMKMGMVREITGQQRGRLYEYTAYLAIMSEGTEPLPR